MTSRTVDLTQGEVERLAWLAKVEGRSEDEIARAAIRSYAPAKGELGANEPPRAGAARVFSLDACFEGDGTSVVDVSDEELLRGFGQILPRDEEAK
ncbi:MAG: hypothetical protein HYX53_07625 [Chloroflexi bacterium]|nr:hypothetical protein [Chloroflexota bacterium]